MNLVCSVMRKKLVNTCFLIVQLLKGVISEILGVTVGDNMVNIGKFWLSNKRNGLVNILTSLLLSLVDLETQE